MGYLLTTVALLVVLGVVATVYIARRVDVQAARRMARSGAQVVDVRGDEDDRRRHHRDVARIPLDRLREAIGDLSPDPHRPLLVYGATASQAQAAIGILRSLGYREVHNLGGYHRADRILAARD